MHVNLLWESNGAAAEEVQPKSMAKPRAAMWIGKGMN
jgi:hypothetical protein